MTWPAQFSAIAFGSPPLPTVLLRHEMPDGTNHVDWMMAVDAEASMPLLTFRCETPLDQLQPASPMHIERLTDHRSAYLTYEGPISGARGRVIRLRHGYLVTIRKVQSNHWSLVIEWEPAQVGEKTLQQEISLQFECDSRWLVICDNIQ